MMLSCESRRRFDFRSATEDHHARFDDMNASMCDEVSYP